jgi:hypothetical protein
LDFNRRPSCDSPSCRWLPSQSKPSDPVENQINADEEAEQPKAARWASAKDHDACWNSEQAGQHHDPIGSAPDADTDA